ncbi:hypothetical protein [Leifsonia poae]|uniref:Uncharacterized protein n=1 Tax=Leifsonia poae TaxID=110933 RepID=A0A9W6H8V6_9MICO|nr:hypothetical protein [Leifsonia poae]GLJ76056.1 hypothetical protein GCM10017584_16300 [Leifsonia poae]
MTLTNLLPTLRLTLPDPLDRDRWPEYTTATTQDVVIAGVSLLRLAEWCSTPCLHTAAAVIPGTGGRPSETELTSVVVVRVEAVSARPDGGLAVRIDGDLDLVAAVTAEARLIGRVSTVRNTRVRIGAAMLELPGDVRAGDLVTVPIAGVARLHDVDPRRHPAAEAAPTATPDAPPSRCGR